MRQIVNEARLMVAITLIGWAAALIPMDDQRATGVVNGLMDVLERLEA